MEIIDDYFDLVFYKDIVERFNLKSFKKLKVFRKIILSYMTNFINYSEI
jgi:predicted AAA+ superfamily ATPase